MFRPSRKPKGILSGGLALLALIYHSTVRKIRQSHRHAVIGLLLNIVQTVMLVGVFYLMFSVLGLRNSAVRGDFLLYLMSGVFLYLTHSNAVGAVTGSEGPTAPMMKHAPMNTIIAITSSALSSLYTQILSMVVVMYIYHAAFTRITIDKPAAAFGMFLLAWFSGVAVGMVFLALKPWFPRLVDIGSMVYRRANMLASGKMFLANTLPGYMVAMFDWNPLFHAIDQSRGFTFINYNPHFSSISYPIYVSLTLITLGLLGEFYTRKRASLSWSVGR